MAVVPTEFGFAPEVGAADDVARRTARGAHPLLFSAAAPLLFDLCRTLPHVVAGGVAQCESGLLEWLVPGDAWIHGYFWDT